MHRRALPIASPCQVFRPTPGRSFCTHCTTHVHDLSAMTRADAEALLAANAGKAMCVAYRTTSDGTLVHRPDPRPEPLRLGVAALALGLAACTGHTPEIEYPGEHCRDPQGYEQDCDDVRRGGAPRIPDAEPIPDEEPIADAEPIEADDPRPVDVDADPVTDDEPQPGAEPIPVYSYEHGDDLVGLVLVADRPQIPADTVVADAGESRKAKREAKRAKRRFRRERG